MTTAVAIWQSLPGSIRWIVAAAGAYLIATALLGTLGFILVLAGLAWAVVALGYLYKAGRTGLPAIIIPVLAWMTQGHQSAATSVASPKPVSTPPIALTAEQRDALKDYSVRQIDQLHGQYAAKRRVAELADIAARSVARKEKGFGVGAPVQMVMFLGPDGTGKTQIAEAFAGLLCGVGACTESKLVELRRRDVTDAGPGKAGEIVEKYATSAIGGILLIEDGSWLARGSDDPDFPFAPEVGKALVDVGVQHPGELIVLVTGGVDLRSRVAERQSLKTPWLNKTYLEIVELEALGESELVSAFVAMLAERKVRIGGDVEPLARQALKKKMAERDFANIHTVRALVDRAINVARMRSSSTDITLTAADLRAALE